MSDPRQEFAVTVGRNIRAVRMARGLTLKQLAMRADAREKDVSRWELGGNLPRLDVVARIAKALDVTVDQLIGHAPLPPSVYEFTERS